MRLAADEAGNLETVVWETSAGHWWDLEKRRGVERKEIPIFHRQKPA